MSQTRLGISAAKH
jgi:mevalonate pyrophosphate decarboxylase